MMTTVSTIKTELVSSDDGEHTYAVTKTLEGVQGDKAVMVLSILHATLKIFIVMIRPFCILSLICRIWVCLRSQ